MLRSVLSSGRARLGCIAVALFLYIGMALSVSPRMGVTADEVVHLTGGYTYWTQNDYRLHPENGNLPQRVATLPLLLLDLKTPPLDHPGWLRSQANVYGGAFFYDTGNPVDQMLFYARSGIVLVGAFLVWLTWRWARGLFGPRSGVAALVLAVFCPALLAHGGLATSDITAAAMCLAALSAVWLLLHRATWFRLALASLACGAAFLAKMSGVLIIPVIAILVLLRTFHRAPLILDFFGRYRLIRKTSGRFGATLMLTVAVAGGSLVVLWAAYGFRYSGFNPTVTAPSAGYYYSWESMLGEEQLPAAKDNRPSDVLLPKRQDKTPGNLDHIIRFARDHRLLPEAYLWGFAQADTFSRYRSAFLAGEHGSTGWPEFFPVAFLLKSTPASLLLALLAIVCLTGTRPKAGSVRRHWIYRGAPLWIFGALYWAVAINTNLNIGHRHILPIYPIFYILASSIFAARGVRARWLILPGCLLLATHAVDSISARPSYLSYFTPLVGGPYQGHRYLVDSSYDWGQGLPELDRWIKNKRQAGDDTPIYLSYFGADSPRARQLDVIQFGDEIYDRGPRVFPARLDPGWYVISATQFRRAYGPGRGPWTLEHEAIYRHLYRQVHDRDYYAAQPAADLAVLTMDYELLQATRLFHALEARNPVEIIGGSLLVFKLDAKDLHAALKPALR